MIASPDQLVFRGEDGGLREAVLDGETGGMEGGEGDGGEVPMEENIERIEETQMEASEGQIYSDWHQRYSH